MLPCVESRRCLQRWTTLTVLTLGLVAVPRTQEQSLEPAPFAPVVYGSGNLSLAIPNPGRLTHTIAIPAAGGRIADVDVAVRLDHPFDQQLRISLTSPEGIKIILADRTGDGGDNFGSGATNCSGTPTRFDDETGVSVDIGAAPFAGTYRPSRHLAALDHSLGYGNWSLEIEDLDAGFSGTLFCWAVTINRGIFAGELSPTRAAFGVWRPTEGAWYSRSLRGTASGFLIQGQAGDIPMSGAFEVDYSFHRLATFRPDTGRWTISSSGAPVTIEWGIPGDIPVPADFNGDGYDDIAVWRPSTGEWFVRNVGAFVWGTAGDVPVPAEYMGAGASSIAVWRPSNGAWFINGIPPISFGSPGDIPVPADYFGSERVEVAVFRPSEGVWYIQGWDGEARAYPFGTNGDVPVPADYDGDGKADIAVWRPSEGRWYVRNFVTIQHGTAGDIPMTKRPSYPTYPY
jgi:subtilisin-like proprotein convertase family protein/putative transposon-encoded protein